MFQLPTCRIQWS